MTEIEELKAELEKIYGELRDLSAELQKIKFLSRPREDWQSMKRVPSVTVCTEAEDVEVQNV